ncbi:hypothetical protein [Rhodococcus daqingensis]|uniref:Lipoprotein n=1 Tax=Rhodococcus daqingensis TaxID=2479363 RepID=A0ABW2S546_9NOCA
MKRTVTALALGATLLLAGCGSDDSSSSTEASAAPTATCPGDASADDPTATVIAKSATLPAGVTVDGAVTKLNSGQTPSTVDLTVRVCGSGLDSDALKDTASAIAVIAKPSLLGSMIGVLTVTEVGGDTVRTTDFQAENWDPAQPADSHRAAWAS